MSTRLVLVKPAPAPDPSVPEFNGSRNGPYSNLHNVHTAFEVDRTLQKLVWYDEFLDRFQTDADGPVREWTDADDVRWCIYLQDVYNLKSVTPAMVKHVVDKRGRADPRHVVRTWLQTLTWDGVPRIEYAFEDYWGVQCDEYQPSDYVRAASRNFLVSLVARVMRPGCQVDTMPVFEGPQGIFKSRALRVLASHDWHVTAHESVGTKDFLQVFQGKWIVEIAELDAFSRAEVTRVKSVMSTPVDRYRPSYGRYAKDYPRQCVFAGTTNVDNWGRDETGLRRFWPVKCGDIDVTRLAVARPQLFAEALAQFLETETWWEMPASTLEVQAARQQSSPLVEPLMGFLLQKSDPITLYEAMHDGLKIEAARITPNLEKDTAKALRELGWVNKPTRNPFDPEKKVKRMWHPPNN